MKIPNRLQPLVDDGLIDEVIRRLKSGKEADVFIVRCNKEIRCAKIYKEAEKRNFKQAIRYQEGRKVRNSRSARAIKKGSKFGRAQKENTWQKTEMEALYLLAQAGVRVPQPVIYMNDVLVMEMITDEAGHAAPRLSDVTLTAKQARADHQLMINYAVRMLCIGLVHGDLSEFNILMDNNGPVIIDLPQVVNATTNRYAQSMFERDIHNISRYYSQYAPELHSSTYAQEIWELYQSGMLTTDSVLSGQFIRKASCADISTVLAEIHITSEEHQQQLMSHKKIKP
ncbi:PA4780 family RIO1-like protein kinase [Candidatus Gillettellia adelgis]